MNASRSPAAASPSLGSIALIALLVASLVLGVLVYRARTPDLALEVTSFPRSFEGKGIATFEFFVRFDEPSAVVEVVGRNQVVTRTLAGSIALAEKQGIRCIWTGSDDEGERAPPGRYRLRVTLPSEGRTMVFPSRLDIEPGDAAPRRVGLTDGPCVPVEESG